MNQIMLYVWLGVIVLSIVAEALTLGLVALWFMPGALIALVLSFFQVGIVWQLVAFVAISVVMVLFGKKIFRVFGNTEKTNTEALIGKTAIISEQVCNVEGRGAAKLGAQEWSARAEKEDEILEVGEHVEIVRITGVKLICRKK